MTSEKIELIDIAKTYHLETQGCPTFRVALKCINVEFKKGEIHSLLGENGAGKSTLVHILSGRIKQTSGIVKIDGKISFFSSPSDAIKKGIAIIFQSLPQLYEATILENIMLLQKGIVGKKIYNKIKFILEEWGIRNVNFNAKLNSLSKEECFLLEIANYLSLKPNVLILDESLSFISPNKKDDFFRKLKEYAKTQKIAVITITHDISEAIKISDKITIIRKGKNLETLDMCKLKKKKLHKDIKIQLEKLMYKRLIKNEKLTTKDTNKKTSIEIQCKEIDNLFIEAKEGEITGFINSNKVVEALLSGVLPTLYKKKYKGGIKFQDGRFLSFSKLTPSLLLKNKIGFIPSDRYYKASNPKLTIKAALSCYKIKDTIIDEKKIDDFTSSMLKEENIETSIQAFCSNLSGGQLQRLILARCLKEEPKIIILVEPMRGLDIASIEATKRKLQELKKENKTILIITQEENIYADIFDRIIY